jgi:murein DD-endopeptidase MepM/ murein hydrolase activator NlpD
MHPLVRGAAAAALLTALNGLERPQAPTPQTAAPPAATEGMPIFCAPRAVPEGAVCVPLPPPGTELDSAEPLVAEPGASRRQTSQALEQIPRHPDRPEDPALYRYPLGPNEPSPKILSGYDLDLPGRQQRHGRGFKHEGHGGIDLSARRGAEVVVVALEHQEGPAEVIFRGELFGLTVATTHMIREGGRLREYVALFGHLDASGPGITPGVPVEAGEVLGYAGDTGSPGIVHLHFELRQVREGVTLARIDPRRLADNAVTVPCDPRNLLPLLQ